MPSRLPFDAAPERPPMPSWGNDPATVGVRGDADGLPPASGQPGGRPGAWQSLLGNLVTSSPDRRILLRDALIGFGVLVLFILTASGFDNPIEPLAALVMSVSLVVRRTAPLLMLMTVSVGALLFVPAEVPPLAMAVVVPLVSYSVARWVPGGWARMVLVVGACGSLLAPVRWETYFERGHPVGLIGLIRICLVGALCFVVVVTPYAIGRRLLQAAQLRDQLEARAVEREVHSLAERDQQVRITEAGVRAQIARELHDIVAHSLSVIIVQAEGGRALATRKPEAAAEVLGTIAETGREALGEMRRIVSVLRDGPDARAEFVPTPGLDDIDELVARSGVRAQLDVVGQIPRVPQTLGLTAYRVVQEALTNVMRHAGPDADAQVLLSCSPHLVVVEVVDNGRGAAADTSDGHGSGLRGMRERVESMGGQLVARPRSSGGFLVRALLPVVETPLGSSLPAPSATMAPPAATPASSMTTARPAPAPSTPAPSTPAPSTPAPSTTWTRSAAGPVTPYPMNPDPVNPDPMDPNQVPTTHLPTPQVTQPLPGAPEPTREFPPADITLPLWTPQTSSTEATTPLHDDQLSDGPLSDEPLTDEPLTDEHSTPWRSR